MNKAVPYRGPAKGMVLACLLMVVVVVPVAAQTESGDPYRFWKWPMQDAAAFVRVIPEESSFYALGMGGLLFFMALHDDDLSRELAANVPPGGTVLGRAVEEVGNVKAIRPIAIVLFVGTLMTDDRRLQDAAFTSLESVLFANLLSSSMKGMFGRARPWEGKGPMHFQPFSGSTSFPSGHATTAFAFVTPWLLYYPDTLVPGMLLLSAGTAFTRIMYSHHWFTDVLAGSAIGLSTAYWLTLRHQAGDNRLIVAPAIGPDEVGLRVQLRLGDGGRR